jgi:hypothetical protein
VAAHASSSALSLSAGALSPAVGTQARAPSPAPKRSSGTGSWRLADPPRLQLCQRAANVRAAVARSRGRPRSAGPAPWAASGGYGPRPRPGQPARGSGRAGSHPPSARTVTSLTWALARPTKGSWPVRRRLCLACSSNLNLTSVGLPGRSVSLVPTLLSANNPSPT